MDIEAVLAILGLFVALPWLTLHYVTKWRQAPRITEEDERLLDEMFNLARRLEDRLHTVERIVAADHPEYRPGLGNADDRPALGQSRSFHDLSRRD